MSEIDKYMSRGSGYGSARVGASFQARPPRVISAEQARELLTAKVEKVLLELFGSKAPWDSVAAVCGRTPEYWESSLKPGRERRKAVADLFVGLRAHISGVRDHLNDVERTVLDASAMLDQIVVWNK